MVAQNQSQIGKGSANPTDPHRTNSGGGPRCQKTMRGTIAQTRFENVSKHSNDSLLARGNTLRSDEDRLKLDELMALCTNLQNKVLDLRRQRPLNIMRLLVGLTARVESSDDEESLGEDASKQGRITTIDTDDDITLVSVHDEMEVDEEVVEVINTAKLIIDATQVSDAGDKVSTASAATTVSASTTTTAITVDDITLAQALEEIKNTKPKQKGVVIQELDQISFDEETALKLQAEFDEEERLARENFKKEQEANIALIETWDDIQAKIDADHQLAKRLQAQEQEEFSIEEKATLLQQLLKKRRKHFVAKRVEEIRNKPPTKGFDSIQEMFDREFKKQKVEDDKETAEIKMLMEIIPDEEEVTIDVVPLAVNHMLKSFDMEDLETLYKLVKAKYKSTRSVEDLDLLIWGDLKTMFEPHIEDKVWRNQQDYKVLSWKLHDSCRVHSLRMQHVHIYMLVEKKYPLTPSTLSMMLEKKLMIYYESEMAYQLYKFIMK
ncbi:hypothetical protein Tco_1412065 [Tanacetum coccineum]